MFSDLSFNDLPFDIPDTIDRPFRPEDPLAPLNFDDLLDIAREFEFTRTITHVWPCEEEPDTRAETRLDDILAALVPTANPKERPIPLPSPAPMTVNPAHLGLIPSANSCTSVDPVPLSRNEVQVQATTEFPIVSTLQGWSPPNGSQFLDLDGLFLFQPEGDMQNSPQPTTFLATSPVRDFQPQMLATMLKPPPVNTTDETADGLGKRSIPIPVQPPARVIFEAVQARSAAMPSHGVTAPRTKAFKSRTHPPSPPATGGATAANYARPPRGGIPPHIARSVTKANILRVERERKVMQDAFSTTATRETKKPSVLRRVAKGNGEMGKIATGGNSGKNPFDWNGEKERRAAKRVKV